MRRRRLELAGVLMLGLAWGIYLSPAKGYEWDVNNFKKWSAWLSVNPVSRFYDSGLWSDYQPGYLYVLWGVGRGYRWIAGEPPRWEDPRFHMAAKLPPLLAVALMGVLIYRRLEATRDHRIGLLACAAFVLNPGILVNEGVWGDADAVPALLVLAGFLALAEGRWVRSAIYIGWACITKPQAAMTLPALAAVLLGNYPWRVWLRYGAVGLAVMTAGWLPFTVRYGLEAPLRILDHYRFLAVEYPFTSVDAFNLWSIGGLFQRDDVSVLGVDAFIWGQLFFSASVLLAIARVFPKRGAAAPSFISLGFFVTYAAFVFWTRMHERYVSYALPLGAIAAFESRDRLWKIVYAGISILCFGNLIYVLYHTYGGPEVYPLYELVRAAFRREVIVAGWGGGSVLLLVCGFLLHARQSAGAARGTS